MPRAGTDPRARALAHIKSAERYSRKMQPRKAIAHFGRALDYSAGFGSPDAAREKPEDPIFYQKRNLRVKSTSETQDVYFVFEKLTEDNLGFWTAFADNQIELSGPSGTVRSETGETKTTISDGTKALKESLGIYSEREYDTWIAYVGRGDRGAPRTKTDADIPSTDARDGRFDAVAEGNEFDQIEMLVSVFGSTKYPITTHMGIFRTYKYWSSVNKPCADLAKELHAFAAFMSRDRYPHALYMVTKPASVMLDILKQKMPDGTFVVGSPFERDKYKGIPKKVELYKKVYVPLFTTDDAKPGLMDDRGDRWSAALDLKDPTERLEFTRPEWFRHDSLNRKATLPTAIFQLEALARLWAPKEPG
jgi:hypothetical protein